MRYTGAQAFGVRLPIISAGDDLAKITAESILSANKSAFTVRDGDVIGITEAVVAKAQGNYADISDISADVRRKFGSGIVGVVFPITSRNRFMNILKGIAGGADEVAVLLSCPSDEVGNPIIDPELAFDIEDNSEDLFKSLITGERFNELSKGYVMPFTGVNYIDLYASVAPNIKVYVSSDPKNILKLTDKVLVAQIHSRFQTKKRLEKAGASIVYTLSDILNEPMVRDGFASGFNADYGVLGSNLSNDNRLKLFPRDCTPFVEKVRSLIKEATGKDVEVLVYGDGAFKDPACGIWELADPVVSPGFTSGLLGQPREIKLKFVADSMFAHLGKDEQHKAVSDLIRDNTGGRSMISEGTTPRRYADLLGSLCDLMSGSGDKGTPVVLIQGYFDNFADE